MSYILTCHPRPICAAVRAAIVSMALAASPAQAGPTGGQVVGGSGSISQSGLNTTINQASQNMAINWQSYDVNSNERVQYIQPNTSSISLNRILSNNGSTIAGRIDANGQVILVNPNGIFFTPTAVVNVGGIIASGLDIQPNDFMNGNYIFNDVLGKDGTVVNTGTINASLGGNVALIGRQVENDGLIAANLGTVTLAAGKQAVLNFDNGGLLGVRVSKAILQDELGVDPAVVNNGTIQASGGRVLLTASTSQNVFSQAVNTNGIQQATSVVVNPDGTFTLGAGADAVNTGTINTSTTSADQSVGRIVMLGNNVTSSGSLKADAANGNGGEIELHSTDTTLLTQSSMTSARSESNGNGGIVKVLGDKVGMFDQSTVDVSGANGGGQALIGGDQSGKNTNIQDASFIYLSDQSGIYADSLDNGIGGKIITFASNTARIYGDLFTRGGVNGGDGGFVETSGLIGFELLNAPDISALAGNGGQWLIDPYNITISSGTTVRVDTVTNPFTATGNNAVLNIGQLATALDGGNTVTVSTNDATHGTQAGDLTFNAVLDYDNLNHGTLKLLAARDITFTGTSKIYDSAVGTRDSLNLVLLAGRDVSLSTGSSIATEGGYFDVGYDGATISSVRNFTNNGSLNTTPYDATVRVGDVNIYATGDVTSNDFVTSGGNVYISGSNITLGKVDTEGANGVNGGDITLVATGDVTGGSFITTGGIASNHIGYTAGSIEVSTNGIINIASILSNGSNGERNGNTSMAGGAGGKVSVSSAANTVTIGAVNTNGGDANGIASGSVANGGDAGIIDITGGTIIAVSGNVSAKGGAGVNGGAQGTGKNITFTGAVELGNTITIDATGTTAGNIIFNNSLDDTTAGADSLSINGGDVTFDSDIGGTTRLGDVTIDATGNVNASSYSITATALHANAITTPALSFTSGDIDASSATSNGGNVEINAGDITVGGIDSSSATGVGGTITLNAVDDNNNGTPTITLNGDIKNASGATAGNAYLTLNGSSSPQGAVIIKYVSDFSSTINITGSAGTDSLTEANRNNTWSLADAQTNPSAISSINNNNILFSGIETLIGNDGVDTFQLPNAGAFVGSVDGGNGIDIVQGGTQVTSWNITGTNSGTVTGLDNGASDSFLNIETLKGNSGVDTLYLSASATFNGTFDGGGGTSNTVVGGKQDTQWTVIGANAVNVTGMAIVAGGSATNVEILQGNNNAYVDTFNLSDSVDFAGSIDGGGGASNEIVGGNLHTYWNVSSGNTGTVTTDALGANLTDFSNIQYLTGNADVDEFTVGAGASIVGIDGGGGANTFTINGTVDALNANGVVGDTSTALNTIDVNSGGSVTNAIKGGHGDNVINIGDSSGTDGTAGSIDVSQGTGSTITVYDNNATANVGGKVSGAIVGSNGVDTITIDGSAGSISARGANDVIAVADTTSVSGLINGGSGADSLTINNTAAVTVTLGTNASNIETLSANGAYSNTLVGDNATNTWDVSGSASASGNTVDDGTTKTTFSGFSILTAGSGGDTFDIHAADIATINGTDAADETFNLDVAGLVATINGGSRTGDNDTLAILNGSNTWTVDASGNGSVTVTGSTAPTDTSTFTSIETRIASSGGNDVIALNGAQTVLLANYQNFGIIKNDNTATLQGVDNQQNDWTIEAVDDGSGTLTDGVGDGQVFVGGVTTRFIDFLNLQGGNSTDNFTVASTGSIQGYVDGGLGANTLYGRDTNSAWTISGSRSGSVGEVASLPALYISSFSRIQNLVGGSGDDTFTFQIDPNATGMTIDGGANPGFDTADLSQIQSSITVLLANFPGMERIIGNNDGLSATNSYVSTLQGANGQTNTWLINDVDGAGTIADGVNDGSLNGTQFINFSHLVGGNQEDDFTVASGGNLAAPGGVAGNGVIDGGSGSNFLTVQNTNIGTIEIGNRNNANLNVIQIGDITGNGTTALKSDSSVTNNYWAITDATSGTLGTITFRDFSKLIGGDLNDIFSLNAQYSFAGSIDGGLGANEIKGAGISNTWAITNSNNTGTVTNLDGGFTNINRLTGGALKDRFVLSANTTFNGTIDGGGGTDNEVQGGNQVNNWQITGANDGSVTGLNGSFTKIQMLTGSNLQDIFTLSSTVNFNGSINGGNGTNDTNDELIGANRTGSNTWTVTGATTGDVSGLLNGFSNIEKLIGAAGTTDTFVLADQITFNGSIQGNAGDQDEIQGTNQGNTWRITGANTGTVTGLSNGFTDIAQLTGGSGQDNYFLADNASFTGNIDGGSGTTNTLTAGNPASGNTWTIDALNGGTTTGLATGYRFTHIQNLTGNGGVDNFILTGAGAIDGLIDGAGGSDKVDYHALTHDISVQIGTGIANIESVIGNNDGSGTSNYTSELVGDNVVNNWTISGLNTGKVGSVNFTGFNNLTGNSNNDTFTFSVFGQLTGIIDGGDPNNTPWTPTTPSSDWLASATTSDTVDMSALSNVDVTLGQDFKNIELVIGNATPTNSVISVLRAGANDSNWDVTGTNSGIVNGTQFQRFNEIHGSDQADTFLVETGGNILNIYGEAGDDLFDIQGTVGITSGGAGTDYIVLHGSNVDVTVGNSVSGFEGITAADGGIIRARNGTTTTWDIGQNGKNYVSDNGLQIGNSNSRTAGESLFFSGFTTIEGGDGTDIFNVTENGSIAGLIDGNGGADQLNLDLALRTQAGGQFNYDGGGDVGDTITINGTGNVYNESFASNQTIGNLAGTFDQLAFTSAANGSFTLGFRNVASVTDNIVVDTLTLNSADANNILQLGANTFGASNSTNVPVNYLANSKNNITVLASNGSDVSITGAVNIPRTLSITADTVSNTAGGLITADTLSLNGTTSVGAQGQGNGLATDVKHLAVQNAGPVYIDQQGSQSLDLAGLNTSNLLDIMAGGDVVSTADLISGGNLQISTAGNVNLSGANNRLSGVLILSEGNADSSLNDNTFVVNNTVDTNLGDISVMDLNIASSGQITNNNASTIVSTGRMTLTSGGDVNLNSPTNDFYNVSVTHAVTVTLNDLNNIGLVSLANASGLTNITSVNITSGGKISDANNGGMNIVADRISLAAVNGIGDGSVDYNSTDHTIPFDASGAIHTQASLLSAINLNPATSVGAGTININNNANVTINDLRNNGDIILNNNNHDITLAVTTTTDQNNQPINLGAIDANYHGNVGDPVYAGSVAILGDGTESVYTLGTGTSEADITAEDLLVYTANQFGDPKIPRPIRLRINRQFSLYSVAGAVSYPNGLPTNPVSTTADLVTIEGITGLSGQQLIDIESLGDVDPAIFTEVRNYNHEDVAILLPPDQRLSENGDDDCKNDRKCKKKNAVN